MRVSSSSGLSDGDLVSTTCMCLGRGRLGLGVLVRGRGGWMEIDKLSSHRVQDD